MCVRTTARWQYVWMRAILPISIAPFRRRTKRNRWHRHEAAKMRVGIVGLGSIGRTVARNLHEGKIPKAVLAGVTVRDHTKAERRDRDRQDRAHPDVLQARRGSHAHVLRCRPSGSLSHPPAAAARRAQPERTSPRVV